jgi:hypothetical protein
LVRRCSKSLKKIADFDPSGVDYDADVETLIDWKYVKTKFAKIETAAWRFFLL